MEKNETSYGLDDGYDAVYSGFYNKTNNTLNKESRGKIGVLEEEKEIGHKPVRDDKMKNWKKIIVVLLSAATITAFVKLDKLTDKPVKVSSTGNPSMDLYLENLAEDGLSQDEINNMANTYMMGKYKVSTVFGNEYYDIDEKHSIAIDVYNWLEEQKEAGMIDNKSYKCSMDFVKSILNLGPEIYDEELDNANHNFCVAIGKLNDVNNQEGIGKMRDLADVVLNDAKDSDKVKEDTVNNFSQNIDICSNQMLGDVVEEKGIKR